MAWRPQMSPDRHQYARAGGVHQGMAGRAPSWHVHATDAGVWLCRRATIARPTGSSSCPSHQASLSAPRRAPQTPQAPSPPPAVIHQFQVTRPPARSCPRSLCRLLFYESVAPASMRQHLQTSCQCPPPPPRSVPQQIAPCITTLLSGLPPAWRHSPVWPASHRVVLDAAARRA
jgi:hypothetical protein